MPFFVSFAMPSATEMRFKKMVLEVSLGPEKYSTSLQKAVVCQFGEHNQASSRFFWIVNARIPSRVFGKRVLKTADCTRFFSCLGNYRD